VSSKIQALNWQESPLDTGQAIEIPILVQETASAHCPKGFLRELGSYFDITTGFAQLSKLGTKPLCQTLASAA